MAEFSIGMVVARFSYGCDLLFKVVEIIERDKEKIALLKGLNNRLMADAYLEDLQLVTEVREEYGQESVFLENLERGLGLEDSRQGKANDGFEFCSSPGRVLHLDGDQGYLTKCLKRYQRLGIEAHGVCVAEAEQPKLVCTYLLKFNPDLLVITGHDGIKAKGDQGELASYHSSSYFAEAVARARNYQSSKDSLVIFAGACQSYYEELIKKGANFASSPTRSMIHAYDPLLVVKTIAYTPIGQIADPQKVVASTISGRKGIGGLETYGCFRLVWP